MFCVNMKWCGFFVIKVSVWHVFLKIYIKVNICYRVVLPVFEWLLSQSCCGWRWPHTKQWEKMHQNGVAVTKIK